MLPGGPLGVVARKHTGQLIDPRRVVDDGGGNRAAFRGGAFLDSDVRVRACCHGRQVRDAQHLLALRQPAQALADRHADLPADAGVDFVEHHRRRSAGAGRHRVERKHHPRQLAAGGHRTQRGKTFTGIGLEQKLHDISPRRADSIGARRHRYPKPGLRHAELAQLILHGPRQVRRRALSNGAQRGSRSAPRPVERSRPLAIAGELFPGRRQAVEPALAVVGVCQRSGFGAAVLADHGADRRQAVLQRKQLTGVHRFAPGPAECIGDVLDLVERGLHLPRERGEAAVDGRQLAERLQRGAQTGARASLCLRRRRPCGGQEPLDLLRAAEHTLAIGQLLLLAVAQLCTGDLRCRVLQQLAFVRGALHIGPHSIQTMIQLGKTACIGRDGSDLLLDVGVPVQQPAVLRRRQQGLVLMLSVDRQQHASELGVVRQRDRYRLDERRSAASAASDPPHEQGLLIKLDRTRAEPPVDLLALRRIEHRGHFADIGARTDFVGRHAGAQGDSECPDDDRLAGPRLAGDGGEPGPEREVEAVDQGIVADVQRFKHPAPPPSAACAATPRRSSSGQTG